MIKYEDYRNDKNFKIDSLTYSEIFSGLKHCLIKVISENEKINTEDCVLSEMGGSIRNYFGKDKNLYPLITLDLFFTTKSKSLIFKREYFCKISPFEIELLQNFYGEIAIVENENLYRDPEIPYAVALEKYANSISGNIIYIAYIFRDDKSLFQEE